MKPSVRAVLGITLAEGNAPLQGARRQDPFPAGRRGWRVSRELHLESPGIHDLAPQGVLGKWFSHLKLTF